MSLTPGTRLGPYEITAQAGAGGMGEVYKAIDTRLGRSVALKIMPPHVAADPDLRARFEREARTISHLHHPHICTLYDLGSHDGTDFLVLEYLEGETLAARLERGRLDQREAMTIGLEVAGALEAAHSAGVIHRDLKPANVMITPTGVKLLDFGIAKVRHSSATAAGSIVPTRSTTAPTAKGAVLGTLQYMAPEQLEGGEADARADIWAFGCLLYEMFTGVRLFDAPRGRALSIRPKHLERVIKSCLERDPRRRWASMTEVRAALIPVRRPLVVFQWAAAAAAVAIVTAVAVTRFTESTPPAPTQPQTLLVADFVNTTGDSVFDGVIDSALAVALESSPSINVYARRDAVNAAAQIGRSGAFDETVARLVARREGVPLLVTGTIAAGSNGYDLSAAVVNSVSGAPLALATEKSVSKGRVLSAIASIAEQLRRAIGDAVVSGSADLARETFTTSSLDAAKAYTVGQDLMSAGRDEEAIASFREAVRIDPDFGRAYAGWALCVDRLGRTEESTELMQKALSLLARMNRRERLRTEGLYTARILQDYTRSQEIFRTLIAEYPADMMGHNNLAVSEFMLLRFSEAFEQGQRVVTMWPQYVGARINLSLYAMYAGRLDIAVEHAQRAIALNAKSPKAYVPLGVIAALNGKDAEAAQWYSTMGQVGGQGTWLAELAHADLEVSRGRLRQAERRLITRLPEDERAKNSTAVASGYALLAEIAASEQRALDVARLAERGRRASSDPKFTYRFALSLLDVGKIDEAKAFATALSQSSNARAVLYRLPLEAEIAATTGRDPKAVLRAAQESGAWWAYYRAAVVLSRLGVPEAEAAYQWCRDHQSQGVSAFYDDLPTLRYYVAVEQSRRTANVRDRMPPPIAHHLAK